MMGPAFKVTQQRGRPIRDTAWAPCVMATVHPSSLLRAPDEEARRRAIAAFEDDLRAVKKVMDELEKHPRPAPQHARRETASHPGAAAADGGNGGAGSSKARKSSTTATGRRPRPRAAR